MNVRNNIIAALLAAGLASASLGGTFAFAAMMQRWTSTSPASLAFAQAQPPSVENALVATGHRLFLTNCAHCHANDATGDEGPGLHGLRKTDARLRRLVTDGIKGEMPRFGEKFSSAELDAIVAFLDSMR